MTKKRIKKPRSPPRYLPGKKEAFTFSFVNSNLRNRKFSLSFRFALDSVFMETDRKHTKDKKVGTKISITLMTKKKKFLLVNSLLRNRKYTLSFRFVLDSVFMEFLYKGVHRF